MMRTIPALYSIVAVLSLLASGGGCNSHSPIAARPATTQAATEKDQEIATLRHIEYYLASDELEGRGIDTPGINTAAEFIRTWFQAEHLKSPPGISAYFQPFDYSSAAGIDPATTLKSGSTTYKLEDDFMAMSFSAEAKFAGDVVFAGYGITWPEKKYDDYADLDVKGKVVLVMRFEPHDSKGKSLFEPSAWSSHATFISKAKNAAEHGAVALMLVNPPDHGNPDVMVPFAGQYPGSSSPIPVLQVEQHVVKDWLSKAGAPDLQTLQDNIDTNAKPDSLALKAVHIEGNVKIERVTRHLKNVMCYVPGTGPNADEFVIVGAHYDHLGRGGPGSLAPRSHEIHHGADDNASGTTSILALADRLSKSPPLPRSILLVTFSAEEEGLIGSQQFVTHPPVPLSKVVAMLNLDMVGRLKDEQLLVGGQGTAAAFDAILKRADRETGLQIKDFGRGGIGPSDHTSFALKKIPVLFLFTGLHSDYHRPTDTADKINYEGMEQILNFSQRLIEELADMPRQQYVGISDQSASHIMGGGARASLGVVPDYSSGDSTQGVKITGTSPDSAAEKAGLKADDILIRFDDKKIDNIYDLTDALASAKPGQKVKIRVLRDGKEITVDATLAERKG